MSAGSDHRKQYLKVFAFLVILTIIEVGVVYMHIDRGMMIGALVALAVTKALAVALYFMHLKLERKALRVIVGIPMLLPPLYAVVLMLEAIFRFTTAR